MKKFKASTVRKNRVKAIHKRRSSYQQGHPIVALHMDQYLANAAQSSMGEYPLVAHDLS